MNQTIEHQTELIKEYERFKTLTPIFISGVMRSGTTLLQRLLDGHPQLLVYPLEDCIIRDFFAPKHGPLLFDFKKNLRSQNAEKIFSFLTSDSRIKMALTPNIDPEEHPHFLWLGSEKITRKQINQDCFSSCFILILTSINAPWTIYDVFDVWMFSYFYAAGYDLSPKVAWVTKSPENGNCHELYREAFTNCRIIHMLRDPRAAYASVRNRNSVQKSFFPSWHEFSNLKKFLNDAKASFAHVSRGAQIDTYVVRYEDLIENSEKTMQHISDFLNINYDEVLTRPTFEGQPWRSNSSFQISEQSEYSIFKNSLEEWKRVMPWYEKVLIEIFFKKELKEFF